MLFFAKTFRAMGRNSKTIKGSNAVEKFQAGEKLNDNNRKHKRSRVVKMNPGRK